MREYALYENPDSGEIHIYEAEFRLNRKNREEDIPVCGSHIGKQKVEIIKFENPKGEVVTHFNIKDLREILEKKLKEENLCANCGRIFF